MNIFILDRKHVLCVVKRSLLELEQKSKWILIQKEGQSIVIGAC